MDMRSVDSSPPPAPRSVMYVHPWDLYDHCVDASLEALEACGIAAIQLAFSYHVATFLHPRNPLRRVHYGEQGALHFDPSVLPSRAWPFPPAVSADVTGPRYLTDLLEALARKNMQAIAWVVYLYNHTLARDRPDLAVRNAHGDRNRAQLCPANPDVRRYAHVLTDAVAEHRPLHGFVSESLSYLPYDYGFLNSKAAVVPGPREELLLSLCFCEHCSAAARAEGVPVSELRHRIRTTVDDRLSKLPDDAVEEDASDAWSRHAFDGTLHAFLNVREAVATSLQQEVLEIASSRGLRVGSTSAEGADARISGVPDRAIRPHLHELRIEVFPNMDAANLRDLVHSTRSRAGPGVPVYALAQLSHFASEGEFVRAFEAARELGIGHFRIYQFGLLTRRQMDWLRRARPIWSDGPEGERDMTRGRT